MQPPCDGPNASGFKEVAILTNLAAEVDTKTAVELYRTRWSIEAASEETTLALRGEMYTPA